MSPPRPPRLLPMLAGGNGIPPNPAAYLLEPKLDGVRVMAYVEPQGVMLTNRKGGDITSHYPEVAGLCEALAPHAAVLDGEVVTFNEQGQSSFQRLQRRMHVLQPTARLLTETPVVFVAFDVLWLDGELLTECPQTERRRILDSLAVKGRAWQTAPVLDATPEELMEACRQLGLEGFMVYPNSCGGHRPRGHRVGQWTIRVLTVGSAYVGRSCRSSSWTSPRRGDRVRKPMWAPGRRLARRPCDSASATGGPSSSARTAAMTTG
ncbi:MAG: hypothetical protein ACRD2W_18890 [Acidimicrobiales bacterium]